MNGFAIRGNIYRCSKIITFRVFLFLDFCTNFFPTSFANGNVLCLLYWKYISMKGSYAKKFV